MLPDRPGMPVRNTIRLMKLRLLIVWLSLPLIVGAADQPVSYTPLTVPEGDLEKSTSVDGGASVRERVVKSGGGVVAPPCAYGQENFRCRDGGRRSGVCAGRIGVVGGAP